MSKSRSSKKMPAPPVHDEVWRDARWRQRLRRRLLAWYAQNARDLPWRREATPYRVWVSEVMLQQTQVATVVPYYERFLRAFPDVRALANADEQELLSLWEGLGYYRRARSMHAAAKQIVELHSGEFPISFDEVIALPGIGRYTAGAILSIACQQRLPVLEGNTQRVFSRWTAMRGTPSETPNTQLLWQIAEQMLPRKEPGRFNQAAMEIGALVCKPKQPACESCPVQEMCAARTLGLQEEIPGKVTHMEYQSRTEFALVVADPHAPTDAPRYLMRAIPKGRRWAGLWDFPRTTGEHAGSVSAAASELSDEVSAALTPGPRITTIKHAVTKYRISLHVHFADFEEQSKITKGAWRYVSVAEMAELPMSVTGRRIANLLADQSQPCLPM